MFILEQSSELYYVDYLPVTLRSLDVVCFGKVLQVLQEHGVAPLMNFLANRLASFSRHT